MPTAASALYSPCFGGCQAGAQRGPNLGRAADDACCCRPGALAGTELRLLRCPTWAALGASCCRPAALGCLEPCWAKRALSSCSAPTVPALGSSPAPRGEGGWLVCLLVPLRMLSAVPARRRVARGDAPGETAGETLGDPAFH